MSDTAQWVTFLTLIVGFGFSWFREARQRQWDKQDRDELAAKVVQAAVVVTAHAETENAKLATVINDTRDTTAAIALKTEAIREQTNGNLEKVKQELAAAMERIASLQTLTERLLAEAATKAAVDRRSHP